MNAEQYMKLAETIDAGQLADLVETLTHAERVQLRAELEAAGCTKLIRSLYYDYKTQTWIEG